MKSTIKEMASVLHATETMADQFARRVQQRLGRPVPYAEILAAMKKIPTKSLSMKRVVAKLRRQWKKSKQ